MTTDAMTFPPHSTFFATAREEAYSTYQLPGDGDLWPACWADDDQLYTANGDGLAFTPAAYQPFEYDDRFDMAVCRISGTPPNLSGTTIATDVGTNWGGPDYNRKPTGMLCVNGTLYLAYQNLKKHTFDSVPAASIAQSTDHGATWTWDAETPMFAQSVFTTIFFLDFGQNSAHAIDEYVYAYGFDDCWRGQQRLFLGRVPNTRVLDRASWQFYTGANGKGKPTWSSDIQAKIPVLEDARLLYPKTFGNYGRPNDPTLGQGGVTYNAPLKRYLFASWSHTTHQFYEAPTPWGPWSLFLSHDFGSAQPLQNRGMYGTSIPSKYISADGTSMYVQSNVCCKGDAYTFALRKLHVQPYMPTLPMNSKDDVNNLAQTGSVTTPISKSTHFGTLNGENFANSLNNGKLVESEDDWDQEIKPFSWWGYTWNEAYNLNKLVYTTGKMFDDGGWFSSGLTVQVRQHFNWIDVTDLHITPDYPYAQTAGTNISYTFTFADTWGDGIRIIGAPGGTASFTSIAELAVYYASSV